MTIRLVKIILCCVFLFQVTFSQTSSKSNLNTFHRKADTETILFLFQNKIFPGLNSKLMEWQTYFEQNYLEESNVYEAFDVFSSSMPLYETILNNWVNEYGNTYPPYVARAVYYCKCAWESRGGKWASETSQEQFKGMERYFSLALEDMKSALKINPRLVICYDMMIIIGMTVSNDNLKKNAFAEALKINPYSYKVRSTYLHTLTPRWGGSYAEMEEFIDESEKYIGYNPELKSLRAHISADKASVFMLEKDYEHAIQYYNEAIKYHESVEYYTQRGECYYRQNDSKRALSDFNHALELKPNNPDLLRRKSSALYGLNKLSDAQATIEEAEKLDPNDKWIKKKKDFYESDGVKSYKYGKQGYDLMQEKRYQDAVKPLTEAIQLNGDEAINFYNRGQCYLQLQQYEEAIKDFKEAIVRKRDYMKSYDALGWVEFRLRRYDDALITTNTIIKLDPNNAEAYGNRALIYAAKGWKSEALSDARRSCEMGYQRSCQLVEKLQ